MDSLETLITTPETAYIEEEINVPLSGQDDDALVNKMFASIANKPNKDGGKINIPAPTKPTAATKAPVQGISELVDSVPFKLPSDPVEPKRTQHQQPITNVNQQTPTNPKKPIKRTQHKISVPDYLEIFVKWDNMKLDPFQELFNYAIFLDHYHVILPELKIKLYDIISQWLVDKEYYRYVHDGLATSFRRFLPPVIQAFVQPPQSETVSVMISFMTKNAPEISQNYDYQNFVFLLSMDRTITIDANKFFRENVLTYILNNQDYYQDLKNLPSISRDLVDIMLGGRCGFYPNPIPQATYKFLSNLAEKDGFPTILGLSNVCECIKAFNSIREAGVLVECREQLLQIEEVYTSKGNVDPKILRTIESLAQELTQLLTYLQNWTEMKTYDEAKEICDKPFVCDTAEQTLLMLQYKIKSYIRMCKDHIRNMDLLLQKQVSLDEDVEQTRVYLDTAFPWIK